MPEVQPELRAVFCAALEKTTAGERGDYLDEACRGRPELRQRVEALLRAHEQASGFLREPSQNEARTVDEPPAGEQPGTLIGPYKLLEEIGEGGMGVVWMAEQTQPVRRKVALKVLKPGMDTRQVVARFEAERQALALMDHPSIAKVHDGGATASGRPYFVMELVKGVPITEFCDHNQLAPRQRLELFVLLCQAVQHAHQKGIIHRDLKPSNVLVTMHDTAPVVKVIDFGIAKALGQELTDKTVFTGFAQMIGTPLYMSPEQAGQSGLDVDTRSDVYSLGVLLYELLTGTTPFDKERFRQVGYDEMRRIIREEEPPRPSTRLSTLGQAATTVSTRRKSDPKRLSRLIRGELDWIVMKCLDKDRTRRYETANALALDVQRYLCDEPLLAGPPSASYRLGKFVRRNKGPVLAGSLLLAVLLAGVLVSTWQAVRATRAEGDAIEGWAAEEERRRDADYQRERAEANATTALEEKRNAQQAAEEWRSVVEFFQTRVLAAPRPVGMGSGLGIDTTIQAAVDAAEPAIAAAFKDQPLVEAAIRDTLGSTYQSLRDAKQAIRQHRRALQLYRTLLGPDHHNTLTSMNGLAIAYTEAGENDRAIRLLEQVLEKRKRLFGDDHRTTLAVRGNLASAYKQAGRLREAVTMQEETLARRKALAGPMDQDTLMTMTLLAQAYLAAGRLREAITLLEQTVNVEKTVLGPDKPATLITTGDLAIAYMNLGRLDRALPLFELVLEKEKKLFGPEHPETLKSTNSLAHAYATARNFRRAIPLFEKTLEKQKARLGAGHENVFATTNNLGHAYLSTGKVGEAVALLEPTLETAQARLGPDHPVALSLVSCLARAYLAAGQSDRALSLYERTLQQRKAKLGADHPHTLSSMNKLAGAYKAMERLADATPLYEVTLKLRKVNLGLDHPETLATMNGLGHAYWLSGRLDEALPLFQEALKRRTSTLGPDHPDTLTSLNNLAATYRRQDRLDKALPLLEETLKRRRANLGADHRQTLGSMNALSSAYLDAGRPAEALPLCQEALKWSKARLGDNHPTTLTSMSRLATAYRKTNRLADAVPLFEKVVKRFKATKGPASTDTLSSMNNLAAAYHDARRFEEAESLYREALAGLRRKFGLVHPDTRITCWNLIGLYDDMGQPARGEPLLRELLTHWKEKAGADSVEHARWLVELGQNLLGQRKYADAELSLRQCLKIHEEKLPDSWARFHVTSLLGGSLSGQKKYPEAELRLLQGYRGLKQREAKIPDDLRTPRLDAAVGRLAELYDAWGQPDRAAGWRQKREAARADKKPVAREKP
jgi:serine/threonine protein kinase/tetratricopeptide (TPR) repeat protein